MTTETILIRRYDSSNKYYDTGIGDYTQLHNIFKLIHDGKEIEVLTRPSRVDVTQEVLIKAYEIQRKTLIALEKTLPIIDTKLLSRVIKSDSGTLTGYIKELETRLSKGDTDEL